MTNLLYKIFIISKYIFIFFDIVLIIFIFYLFKKVNKFIPKFNIFFSFLKKKFKKLKDIKEK